VLSLDRSAETMLGAETTLGAEKDIAEPTLGADTMRYDVTGDCSPQRRLCWVTVRTIGASFAMSNLTGTLLADTERGVMQTGAPTPAMVCTLAGGRAACGEQTCWWTGEDTQRGESTRGELEGRAWVALTLLTASTDLRGVISRLPPEGDSWLPPLGMVTTPRGVDPGDGFCDGPVEHFESARSFSESERTVTSIWRNKPSNGSKSAWPVEDHEGEATVSALPTPQTKVPVEAVESTTEFAGLNTLAEKGSDVCEDVGQLD